MYAAYLRTSVGVSVDVITMVPLLFGLGYEVVVTGIGLGTGTGTGTVEIETGINDNVVVGMVRFK